MAKGFKYGAGGGTSLNFKVVGNPQPENPKQNTLWVDTDVEITGWDFNAIQPENPIEGSLWVITGSSSGVEFNALKKNSVAVYPIAVKQYIGGAWVDKNAKTYQNGEWVEWKRYLYKDGDEFTSITGGLVGEGKQMAAGEGGVGAAGITRNIDTVTINCTSNGNGAIIYFANKIDLTGYKTLKYEGTSAEESALNWHTMRIWSAIGTYITSNTVAYTSMSYTTENKQIDVSNLSGEYYIGFGCYTKNGFTMSRLWLE